MIDVENLLQFLGGMMVLISVDALKCTQIVWVYIKKYISCLFDYGSRGNICYYYKDLF